MAKTNYVTVLPRIDIGPFNYDPVIDVTRAVSPRKATSNIIANHHRRNIGLIMSALDDWGGAENYSMGIPEQYDILTFSGHYYADPQKKGHCVAIKPKITPQDIRTAQEIEVCQFIASIKGRDPRSYLDQARTLLDKIS